MRMLPVRTMEAMVYTVAIWAFVLVVAVFRLTHGLPAFLIPSRMISGRRRHCLASGQRIRRIVMWKFPHARKKDLFGEYAFRSSDQKRYALASL